MILKRVGETLFYESEQAIIMYQSSVRRHKIGPVIDESTGLTGASPSNEMWSTLAVKVAPITVVATAVFVFIMLTIVVVNVVQTHTTVDTLHTGAVDSVFVNGSDCGAASDRRRNRAYGVRLEAAYANYIEPVETCHVTNGDAALYSDTHFAAYTKGLTHDADGHVDATAYAALIKASTSGLPSDWDAVPLATGYSRKLVNPQAGGTFSLQGSDAQSFPIAAPPTFASAEQAAEYVEDAWMAYTRDVPFALYGSNSRALAAVVEIGGLSDFRGPPIASQSLFRGTSPGCVTGPYISQFLYLPVSLGVNEIDMRLLPAAAGEDFMTTMTEYLRQQNAQSPVGTITYGTTPVFIRNMRDLATWVHSDVLFQAYFQAMLCLLKVSAPLKPSIPYVTSSQNQVGFGTFGDPFVAAMSTIGAMDALKAAWYLKWNVHRRLRPEVYGARLHNHKVGVHLYPLHADALNSTIVDLIYAQTGTYLLPQAFPEGSPLHGSYPAGHATVAGISVTILKALFVETTVLSGNLMPNPDDDGATTVTLSPTATLTVGGELNKLAWNIALGRNGAGVHWRSDATESLKLGERIAIRLLRDLATTYPEPFEGFTFTDFDGNAVSV